MNATELTLMFDHVRTNRPAPVQTTASAIALLALIAPAEAARLLCDRLGRTPSEPITPPRRG
jgi:hypothetical protein